VQTGKLKVIFMDFPLPFHQNAMKAAEAADCANDQGKFWEMHDKLFAGQQALAQEDLIKYAAVLGLDVAKFKECLEGGKHDEAIKKSMAEGQKDGVSGTPSFLLGFVEPGGKVKAVKLIVGAQPYAVFKEAIDGLLSQEQEKAGKQKK
jgi:protein-disulfide isomerase